MKVVGHLQVEQRNDPPLSLESIRDEILAAINRGESYIHIDVGKLLVAIDKALVEKQEPAAEIKHR